MRVAASTCRINVSRRSDRCVSPRPGFRLLISRLPAWGQTLRSRVAARPKVHVVDSGVAAWLLRLTEEKFGRLHPTALTELGHLMETFCVGELRKQLSWLPEPTDVGHWRTHDGAEVDLVDFGGIVLYTGERSYTYEDRLHAVSIDRLWTHGSGQA